MGHHKLIQNGLPSCGNSLRKSPPSRRIDADRPSHPAAESPTARKLGLDHSMVGVECAVVAHLMACCCGHMACRCGAAETRARPKHVLCMCVLLYDCFHFIFQQGRKTPKFHFIFLIPKKLNKIFLNTFLGQANEKFSVLGWSLHWFENFNSQGLKHPEKVIINYIRSLFINEVTKILRFIALPSIWHAFVNKVIKHNNVWQTIVLGRLLLPNIVMSIFPKL